MESGDHQSRNDEACICKITGSPTCLIKLNKIRQLKRHKNAKRIELELAQNDGLDLNGIEMGF
jgi:hypothetical protein